jgi:hypothetical protein
MIAICFLIFGIVFLLSSLGENKKKEYLKKNGEKSVATLVKFENTNSFSDPSSKTTNSIYSFQDKLNNYYEIKSISYNVSDKIGQQTPIYFDPKRPNEYFSLENEKKGFNFGIIVSILFIILGVIFCFLH